ncbi:hypothetical protein [Lacticaseibacillus suibinensis]|uniref:hypothetical protein n=1 Tax=Lacticaseibacillus suibinensis TaxID=2486011 RepID=UPI000F79B4F2|nr:hypothetical protein [Lacticaseibacillus suibinensis]
MMDINDLGEVNAILTDASNIGLALSDKIQALYDLSSRGINKKDEGIVLFEVTRSSGTYEALLSCMMDKIIDSRRLLEAGMKQGGDPDADNA